jgi:hypothetical protein
MVMTSQQNQRTTLKYNIDMSVSVVADNTYVGTGTAFVIPAGVMLEGFLITGGTPGGTAGGAKTVACAVGTVANADADLSDGTDIDVMASSGDKTAAFAHGDAASDHAAAYFVTDQHAKYIDADTTLYLNFIGKSASATGTPGTVTCSFIVRAMISHL